MTDRRNDIDLCKWRFCRWILQLILQELSQILLAWYVDVIKGIWSINFQNKQCSTLHSHSHPAALYRYWQTSWWLGLLWQGFLLSFIIQILIWIFSRVKPCNKEMSLKLVISTLVVIVKIVTAAVDYQDCRCGQKKEENLIGVTSIKQQCETSKRLITF